MPGKRVRFDDETWHALDLLARESMKDFQELADEAFADLLHKHDRPVTLRQALKASVRRHPANDPGGPDRSPPASGRARRQSRKRATSE
jgi:hypothetical protein